MKISGFGKTQSHKRFKYAPRYYDADREELELQIKEAKQKANIEIRESENKYAPGTNIKGKMHKYYISTTSSTDKYQKLRKVIIIVTALLLIAVVYLFLDLSSLMLSK